MTPNADLAIYAVHAVFWAAFGLAIVLTRRASRVPDAPAEPHAGDVAEPVVREGQGARFANAVVAFHGAAFAVMYFGLGAAVLGGRVPHRFDGQRIVGGAVVLLAAALAAWAAAVFRSWRLRPRLDAGHQLATGGPFRYLRHPIYMALNLLALGSAIWVPTILTALGVVLMVAGSELRARTEERLLLRAFGATYRDYCARTRRFVPGLY